MADGRDRKLARGVRSVNKVAFCQFERLTRLEIGPGLARIEDGRRALQMALLTDTVAHPSGELRRIHDGTGHRALQMLLARPVAAFTGDGGEFRNRGPILPDRSGMAGEAVERNAAVEIERGRAFIAGGSRPFVLPGVERCRRLKQAAIQVDQKALAYFPGANGIGDGVIGGQTGLLNSGVQHALFVKDRHRTAGPCMGKRSVRHAGVRRKRLAHGGSFEAGDFARMAGLARLGLDNCGPGGDAPEQQNNGGAAVEQQASLYF